MARKFSRVQWRGVIGSAFLIVLMLVGTDRTQAERPSLAALAKRGAETKARLHRDPARWEVSARTGPGVRYDLRVVSAPPNFEIRILVTAPGQKPHRFARVISLNGKWYVEELGGVKGIYRPWQAPFSFEIAPLLLSEAWPRTYKLQDGHRFERIDGAGLAFVRVPLVAEQRTRAESFLRQAARSGIEPTEELAKNIAEIRNRLEHGNVIGVDASNGLARTAIIGMMTLEFGAVEWLERAPDLPALRNLPDFTAPLPEERDNLVMIGHYGAWKPGASQVDPGGRLLNLDNGKIVRIPFVGGTCMPGCFVGDRSQVAVTGLDSEGGHLGLYLVDLKTGKQRRLGGDPLATGNCSAPVLSPDGKRLAVIHQGPDEKSSVRRVFLVELESGKTVQASGAFEGRSFSWMPDGKALVGVVRRPGAAEKKSDYRVVRFGLDGEVRELLANTGRFVQVVGQKRDRLLVQARDLTWFTCNLEGGDLRKLEGDLRGLTSPTVSPDGKRVLMIAHERAKGMSLVIVDLATGVRTPVGVARGWWSTPAWQ